MRLLRFGVVGVFGAIAQALVFDFLIRAGMPGAPAAAIAVEVALLHNFVWHERFTWSDRQGRRAARLFRFHVSNGLVSIAGNASLAWLLIDRLGAPPLPSALAAIAVCAPLNFLLADRWVYLAPN